MKRKQRRGRARVLGLALAACCTLPAWSLDLAQAYGMALQHDATLRTALATAQAARERLPQARAQFYPSVSANFARAKNELDTTAPNAKGERATTHDKYNSRNDTLSLRQPIFRKQLMAQYHRATATVADAEATLEREQQNLVMRVTQAYFETLGAEQQLVLIALQKTTYTTLADAARKAFAAGAGTRTDIEDAQAKVDLTLAQEAEARQNLDLARRQLQMLINEPVVANVAPVDASKLPITPPAPATVEEWTALAEAASPELQSARAQVDAAQADIEQAKAGHYPTLDATLSVSRSNSENVTRLFNEFDQRQIGLQLSVPLFQGGYVNSQVREALALLDRAQSRVEELRRDLGLRVHREFSGVAEGVTKVKALEQAVRSSEQSAISSRRSFEAGARTRLDILNAETQAGTARRDLAQARFAYLVARVRLKALAGGFRPENIDEINGWLQH